MAKHCSQVARLGIKRFVCTRSAGWTRIIWPSNNLEMAGERPLAGGISEKSTNCPDSMSSTRLVLRAGRPGATTVVGLGMGMGIGAKLPFEASCSCEMVSAPGSCPKPVSDAPVKRGRGNSKRGGALSIYY